MQVRFCLSWCCQSAFGHGACLQVHARALLLLLQLPAFSGRGRCRLQAQQAPTAVQAIWSHLLRNFDMDLVDDFPDPDYQSMVVGPKPCRIRYRRCKL